MNLLLLGSFMRKYYEAYEDRYKVVHSKGLLWETNKCTLEIKNIIDKYNISKKDNILDLGCGEGRDAIYLLDNGYNVYALDYSKSAISMCNKLTNDLYKDRFFSFDIFKDKLNKKFSFIYSVAVIHMFVDEVDRNNFYKFIYDHLSDDGIALVISMGDGINEIKSNIDDAFKFEIRKNINNNMIMNVAVTSCRVKNIYNMMEEINSNNFDIVYNDIIYDVPCFKECMLFLIKKK